MAAPLKKGDSSPRRRVFVLVDKGEAQGVFLSWDAAEAYADENRFSLDHLYEFETRPDHPDHLHLMAGQWDSKWKFVGEWTKKTPDWKQAPERIRLDHYHVLGEKIHLLRSKDFKWREGVLEQINPMAPDAAMKIDSQIKSVPPPEPKPQWKPKLTPLKPVARSEPEKVPDEPAPEEPQNLPDQPDTPDPDNPPESAVRPPLMEEEEPPPAESPSSPSQEEKPKASFSSRIPLRLKSDRTGPQPIPHFQNVPQPPPQPPTTTAGLPEAGQRAGATVEESQSAEEKAPGKVRRVWPMRLIVPILAVFAFWGAGLYWALKPPATTQSIISEITSLANARTLAIEPGQIFFQMEVDPVHQQRWVRSLGLLPIPFGKTFTLPQYHALDTWEKPTGFIRPPYAEVEVREWWDLRHRRISYGFFYEWEDGTLLILDLQGDLLLGWGRARNLPDLMN